MVQQQQPPTASSALQITFADIKNSKEDEQKTMHNVITNTAYATVNLEARRKFSKKILLASSAIAKGAVVYLVDRYTDKRTSQAASRMRKELPPHVHDLLEELAVALCHSRLMERNAYLLSQANAKELDKRQVDSYVNDVISYAFAELGMQQVDYSNMTEKSVAKRKKKPEARAASSSSTTTIVPFSSPPPTTRTSTAAKPIALLPNEPGDTGKSQKSQPNKEVRVVIFYISNIFNKSFMILLGFYCTCCHAITKCCCRCYSCP
jgi:hypothetical protein